MRRSPTELPAKRHSQIAYKYTLSTMFASTIINPQALPLCLAQIVGITAPAIYSSTLLPNPLLSTY